MKLPNRIIERAKDSASRSTYTHRMGAVIFDKRGTIISCGCNFAQRSAKHLHPKFYRWPGSIHAEMDAVIKARTDLKGMNILVVRINKAGNMRLAKPCQHCQMYLRFVKIKNCYFSNRWGEIVQMEVN